MTAFDTLMKIKTNMESNTVFSEFNIYLPDKLRELDSLGLGKHIILSITSSAFVDYRLGIPNSEAEHVFNVDFIIPFGLDVTIGSNTYSDIEAMYNLVDYAMNYFNNFAYEDIKVENITANYMKTVAGFDDVLIGGLTIKLTERKAF